MTRKPIAKGDFIIVKGWGRGVVLDVYGENIHAHTEDGEVLSHVSEVRRSRNRSPLLRDTLPYVLFVCADGREVLANRDYGPLWTRSGPGKTACRAKNDEFVEGIIAEYWFYTDRPPHRSKRSRDAAEAALWAFIDGAPIDLAATVHVETNGHGE